MSVSNLIGTREAGKGQSIEVSVCRTVQRGRTNGV